MGWTRADLNPAEGTGEAGGWLLAGDRSEVAGTPQPPSSPCPSLSGRTRSWCEAGGAKCWCRPLWRTGWKMPTTRACASASRETSTWPASPLRCPGRGREEEEGEFGGDFVLEAPRGSRVRLGVQSLGRESGRSAGSHRPPLCPQRDRPVKVECAAPAPHARLCGVGHPVFPTGAKAGRGPGWERGCVRARAGAAGPGVQGRGHQGSCSSVAAPEEESAMTPCPLPPR